MAVYKARRKDVKYYVEEAMRKLNYTTNSNYTNELNENECSVVYNSFDNSVETQESYWDLVWLKIIFNVNDNNEVPYKISNILSFVTKYVEESEAPNCTSFMFGPVHAPPLGTTTQVEMSCCYKFENDWMDISDPDNAQP
jgi:hypothetical protein